MKKIKEYIRMCIAFEQSKSKEDFWWRAYIERSRKNEREIKLLKKILRWKRYRDYDPFAEERRRLNGVINTLNSEVSHSREGIEETIKELKKDRTELLEIKDSHYKLIAAIKINDNLEAISSITK